MAVALIERFYIVCALWLWRWFACSPFCLISPACVCVCVGRADSVARISMYGVCRRYLHFIIIIIIIANSEASGVCSVVCSVHEQYWSTMAVSSIHCELCVCVCMTWIYVPASPFVFTAPCSVFSARCSHNNIALDILVATSCRRHRNRPLRYRFRPLLSWFHCRSLHANFAHDILTFVFIAVIK